METNFVHWYIHHVLSIRSSITRINIGGVWKVEVVPPVLIKSEAAPLRTVTPGSNFGLKHSWALTT